MCATNSRTSVSAPKRKVPVQLVWSDVTYTVRAKKSTRTILDHVSGRVEPQSLLALMGPSGSGKTSLLNTLAGRVPINKGSTLRGSVTVNGSAPGSKMPLISAYVEQDEALFALSTVRETFTFAARLRLPAGTSKEEQRARVDAIIGELGLVRCADTLVGNQRIRGVSGGERKRVNIGVELLNDPPLVFLDEPTSGLDSFQAQSVMQSLHKLANAGGRTVVASIHQPRSSVYAMFHKVALLSGGRTAYFGPAGDSAARFFEEVGYPIPSLFNPADHFLDVICVDHRDEASAGESTARVEAILAAWAATGSIVADGADADADGKSSLRRESATASLKELTMHRGEAMGVWGRVKHEFTAMQLLTRRTFRELMRDKEALIFQNVANLFFALMFGLVYLRMDESQTSLQNRAGILFFMVMNTAFGASIDTSSAIPAQLQVVNRERAARMYAVLPFYLATFLCELVLTVPPQLINASIVYWMTNLRPGGVHFLIYIGIINLATQCAVALGMVLSAAIKSVEAVPKVAPAVVVLLLMFSGYFLNVDSIPVWLVWIRYLSFIGWGFQALCVNEFEGRDFECKETDASCLNGDEFLQQLNFQESIGALSGYLIAIMAGFHLVAFVVLVSRSPKFLGIQAARHGDKMEVKVEGKAVDESPLSATVVKVSPA